MEDDRPDLLILRGGCPQKEHRLLRRAPEALDHEGDQPGRGVLSRGAASLPLVRHRVRRRTPRRRHPLPEEGGEARLEVGGEEVLKGTITRIFSSYGEVPRTLADFKGLLDKPLNDREKQLVGRWEHVNEEAQLRSWHINREDHTASSFTISPKYDDEGEVVPGEQIRTMNHHIWCVADEVVYFVPLVINQTVNLIADSQVLRAPNEIGTLYLVSVDGEKRTFRWKLPDDYGGDAIEPFHDRRIEAFDETEMKPFNAPGALKGFDLLKVYAEARDSGETGGDEKGVPVTE